MDPYFLDKQISFVKEKLAYHRFKGEYWVTDWGITFANRCFIQDSCFRGVFVAKTMIRCHEMAEEFGLFYASDLLSVFRDSSTILSGSAGLISRHGIRKPVCYAYEFLSELGRYVATRTEHFIVTMENDTDIRILCFHDALLGPEYFMKPEDSYTPEEIRRIFINRERKKMELQITMVQKEDTYLIRQRRVNEQFGSVLDKWIDFACSEDLLREDVEYLRQISIPEIISERKRPKDGILVLHLELEPNEFRYISITKF